ncbi:lipoprotein [uncultured Desulfuromonas sp.]|uniref:lipoprotein n=1 Tax=uncultured Desulfuromonas sp. TaxID=181013 RepID=UPI00261AC65D|nr:lipoprotein [uncultured Desulfuromonas sp.]
MRRIVSVIFLALVLAGCGDQAKDLFETAQFEEKQFNEDHAAQLYRQVLEKFPDSPYAAKARERLAQLGAE